jgi:hypothetical protein
MVLAFRPRLCTQSTPSNTEAQVKNLAMLGLLAVFVLWGVGKLAPDDNGYTTVFRALAAQATPTTTPKAQFARTFHEKQNSICINNRTREHYKGELVSREEVVHELSKHFAGDQIEIMAAITISEGQRDLNCIGDELPYLNGKRLWGKATADGTNMGRVSRPVSDSYNPGGQHARVMQERRDHQSIYPRASPLRERNLERSGLRSMVAILKRQLPRASRKVSSTQT